MSKPSARCAEPSISSPKTPSSGCSSAPTLNTGGEIPRRLEAWEQASFLDPKNTDALSNLGVCERNHGELGLSLFYQRRAVAIDPKHAEGWNNLGIAEMKGDDDEAAKRAFMTAISVRPDYADAHLALGMALAQRGRL